MVLLLEDVKRGKLMLVDLPPFWATTHRVQFPVVFHFNHDPIALLFSGPIRLPSLFPCLLPEPASCSKVRGRGRLPPAGSCAE